MEAFLTVLERSQPDPARSRVPAPLVAMPEAPAGSRSPQSRSTRLGLSLAVVELAQRVVHAADLRRVDDAVTIAALRAEVAAQAAQIRSQSKALVQARTTFDEAMTAAGIGLWECDLPCETLRWSEPVFDLFEFPRGKVPDRSVTLACYPEEARRRLIEIRAEALACQSTFSLDTEIVGRKGTHRWIRITATVERRGGVPVRLFGLKQDITEEKLRSDRTRYLAEYDFLTGLANRAHFQSHLASLPETGTLLLIDLDGFKAINDAHGHAAGDVCLKEAARRLAVACHGADLIARIGGDEFAVLVMNDPDGSRAETFGQRIVTTMRAPVLDGTASHGFGASVGMARARHFAPADLVLKADEALYAAKAAGRGRVRVAVPDRSFASLGEHHGGI